MPINTILDEIRRGTTTQIKQGNHVEAYLADTGEALYKKHRSNYCRTFKLFECSDFIKYTVDKLKTIHGHSILVFGKLSLPVGLITLKWFAPRHYTTI